jgi:O-antigen ligase
LSAVVNGLPSAAINAKAVSLLASAAVALGIFLSGFVRSEPAPYDIYMAGLVAVWALFGLRISRHAAVLLTLLVGFNLGGLLSMTQLAEPGEVPLYLAVSLFLALTAVFVAAVTEATPELFRLIFRAWVAAAMVTGMLGIAGYFQLFPGAETFTRFGRATGAFQDPNVFGPFLVLPGIYMLHRLLTGSAARMPFYAATFLIIFAGVFVSFSRGAWGLLAVSGALLTASVFLRSGSGLFRLRITVMAVVAILLLTVALIAALQMPGVGDFLAARAQLAQEYDSGHVGRFARQGIGFAMAMEKPLGIGAFTFARLLGEDPHNIWLKALMAYGWLGFASFAILVALTIAGGFRILFRERPWQPYLLCAYIVFVGHIALGSVIDMDHWRHFYLLIGLIWGAMALEQRHQMRAPRDAPRSLPAAR